VLRVVPALVVAVCLLVVSPVQAELATVKGAHGFTYSVHFPSNYDVSKQWPMVTLFHWSTGRYGSVYKLWKEIAEENGIILAMPNSRSRMRWTRRDAKKTVSMINAVKSQFNIDPKRVYAVGYSSGANFAYRLMADNPGLFRAVAPFAGRLLASDSKLTHDALVCIAEPCPGDDTVAAARHSTSTCPIPLALPSPACRRLAVHALNTCSTC